VELPAWLDWTLAITAIFVVIEVAGVVLAVDAVMRGRTPQGTIAWVVSLVLLPIAAIPFYLVFGNRRFHGYVRAIRRGQAALRSLWERAHEAMAPHAIDLAAGDGSHCLGLAALAAMPATEGNRARLLVDGDETFDAIVAAIERAERDVLLQFYIVRDDEVGRRVREALVAARRRGVAVRFLYDEIGCSRLDDRRFFAPLVEAGGEVHAFLTTRRGNRFQIQFRNHRKIVVVDGRIAFVGGLNLGREYLGLDPDMGPWRDTHIELEGPATAAVQLAWCEDWHWATGAVPDLDWVPEAARRCGSMRALVLPSGPADELETCSLMFLHLITRARRRLWIASPYFVPDPGIISALQLAAKRGVDVRVMMPEKSDNLLVRFSMFSFYPDVIPAGVKLYRHTSGFLHHKVVLADDTAAIGTANLDNRSFRINFEITVIGEGPEIAEAVAAMMRHDFERCHGARLADFTARPWWFRAAARAARLLSPVQ
jgi:cardiolipin synthase